MIKLTRLNQHQVAINPDNILWADASPDTTLCLAGGEKLIVRESLDELIERIAAYQASLKARATTGAFPRPAAPGTHATTQAPVGGD
ncbi:MAG: flagellar FlbD family protein [Deltaproteobacteria bacterium]|nr:flagellar FlbD family protein [Deltaproteobacteria bacterium]